MSSRVDLLNHIDLAICIIGRDRKIHFINQQAARQFGITTSAAMGESYTTLIKQISTHETRPADEEVPILKCLRDGQPGRHQLHIANDGTYDVHVSALRDAKGQVLGAVEIYIPHQKNPVQEFEHHLVYHLREFVSRAAMQHVATIAHGGEKVKAVKKFCTIMFVDIVGFTTKAEKLSEHETVEMLNIFFDRIEQTLSAFHGDIDKFLGDAVLVVFDKAEDAVQAAIELVTNDLPYINRELLQKAYQPGELKVHIGLNTGWVIVGELGSGRRKDFSVIGDAVNLAARIQSLSPPNQIYISSHVLSNLKGLKNLFHEADYLKVKGKKQFVKVYKATPTDLYAFNHVMVVEKDNTVQKDLRDRLHQLGRINITMAKTTAEARQKWRPQVDTVITGPSIEAGEIRELVNDTEIANASILPVSNRLDEKTKEELATAGVQQPIAYETSKRMNYLVSAALRHKALQNIQQQAAPLEDTAGKSAGLIEIEEEQIVINLQHIPGTDEAAELVSRVDQAWHYELAARAGIKLALNLSRLPSATSNDLRTLNRLFRQAAEEGRVPESPLQVLQPKNPA